MKIAVISLLIIQGLAMKSDYKLELTQDPPSVPRTFPFSLSCKIHKSVNLVGRIDFYRDIFVVASVTQKSRQCSEFTIHADFYSLKCGQGTDSQGSETKEYILSTRRSSYRKDSNLWTCRVADTEAISNVLVVVINNFDLKIRVAEQYAIVGKPFRVTCLINNAADFKDEIIFFRNGAFLLSFFQHRDSCFPFMNQHEEDYEAMCSDQANDRYRRVKRYIASCRHASMEDATIWACVMLSHNIRSNNLSLGVSKDNDNLPSIQYKGLIAQAMKSHRPEQEYLTNPYIMASVVILGITSAVLIVALTIYIRGKQRLAVNSTTKIIDEKTEENSVTGFKNPMYDA